MKEVQIGPCTLINADCLEALPTIGGVHSCCTDPPYHLTSIVKRFGAENAAPAKEGKTGAYARASKGFMGQMWDGGDIAFRPDLWALVASALRPGGHLAAFSGSRTYHRMACVIEDGGFDMRDMLMWIYGSGFPKSHDVSKGIDKRGGEDVSWFGHWLRKWRAEKGITQKQVAALFPSKSGGLTGCVANWELGLNTPTPDQFNLICSTFGLPFASLEEAEREVIGKGKSGDTAIWNADGGMGDFDVTAPASQKAKQWEGWGTALKPAHEPIAFARKPLSESSIASNVLKHGTGAINVDAGRVKKASNDRQSYGVSGDEKSAAGNGITHGHRERVAYQEGQDRWPANVITDGSLEVYELFPPSARDSIRFFYSPKASADDRNSGLDSVEIIKIDCPSWESEGRKVLLRVDTGQLPPRVIAVSGAACSDASEWSMWLFGRLTTGLSRKAAKSTIATRTSSTTESRTLSWLLRSLTSAGIAGVSGATENGGSPAENADKSVPSLTITSAWMGSPPGANSAPSETQWRISGGVSHSAHPTVKPVDLMRWLCRLITPPGGIILDPFMGSGSTGIAAVREGFRFIGIEQSPEYFEIACRRIEAAVKQAEREPDLLRPKAETPKQMNLLEL